MNVQQAVPFFSIRSMSASVAFYETLGFAVTKRWIDDGRMKWCWLQREGAALMLQEFDNHPEKPGDGVTICFICEDALALYRDWKSRGLTPRRPFVGNAMWVVEIADPDGYKLIFESDTDAEEESEYNE
ncbi:MAG: VOC family protein [Thermoanaerobaculia bacterium]